MNELPIIHAHNIHDMRDECRALFSAVHSSASVFRETIHEDLKDIKDEIKLLRDKLDGNGHAGHTSRITRLEQVAAVACAMGLVLFGTIAPIIAEHYFNN